MAEIRPFRGLHYNLKKIGTLENVIAPPYDVISAEKREELLNRSPHNIIRVILGDPNILPASELENPRRYREAAQIFRAWKKENVLIRNHAPSLYVIEDSFSWRGEIRIRVGLLAIVRLHAFGQGLILPHERTLAVAVEDRLRLMRETKAHLSPAYMLFQDEDSGIENLLSKITKEEPFAAFSNPDEPLAHRIWHVLDPQMQSRLVQALKEKPFLIADGHHRYTTALHYAENHGDTRSGAQWMPAFLAPTPSPGVVLSAIHRRIPTEKCRSVVLKQLSSRARLEEMELSWEIFERSKAPLALVDEENGRCHAVFPKSESLSEIPSAFRDVPSSVFNDVVVRPIFGFDPKAREHQGRVRFAKSTENLLNQLRAEKGLGFWLRSMTVPQILSITKKGHVLPQKSTFFSPKVISGMAIHPVDSA